MKRDNRGYYDIDITLDEILTSGGRAQELFYIKDLKQRKLFLDTDFEQISPGNIAKHIMKYNAEDKGKSIEERKPIILYVASNGGEIDAGFELIDVIRGSKTPVYTVNLGYQYSMGFLIGLAGHKRFAVPNAKFLMHDGSNFIWDSGAKAQDKMEFQKKVEARIRQYVVERSHITEEEYDSKLRVEWYLFADEAKEKGFCDYILGVDCDMDDIV